MGVAEEVEHVLLVAVDPGFRGARPVPHVLEKARRLRKKLQQEGREEVRVGYDGGVNLANAGEIAKVADLVVSGSAVMRAPGPRVNLGRLMALFEGKGVDK